MSGESRYCTAADLRALVPDLYRDAALADSFGGANADPGLLDIVLSAACDEVDALISGRVRLPLPPDAIPSKLRTAAALFAAETLCIRRGAILPDALAAKVKWWRDWLSKIGEGDLRLAATSESDDEASKARADRPAAITARPAITGSHGLLGSIALLFALGAGLLAGSARAAVGHRTFSLAAPPDPATFSAIPSIEWERGESVTLDLSGPALDSGQLPAWQVADASNLWFSVASTNFSFHAAPGTAAIPPGRYLGRVVVTNADSSLVRVLAVQNVRVLPGAPDTAPPEPADTLATVSWVSDLAAALSNALHDAEGAISGFSAHVEDTGNPHEVTLRQAIDADADGAFEVMDDAFGIEADSGEFVAAHGYAHSIRFDDSLIEGNFEFAIRPTHGNQGLATTGEVAEAVADLSLRIDGLFAECQGSWRWPDYFTVDGVETGMMSHAATNTATTTQTDYNVMLEAGTSHVLNGWRILTRVYRQSDWDRGVSWAVAEAGGIDPEALEVEGDEVFFAAGATAPEEGAWVRMAGSLGECSAEAVLEWDAAAQSATSTVYRFTGPAAGSLLAASWNTVLGAASNGYAASPRKSVELRTWPNGYGNRTNHVSAGWNTNFWGYGLGDFSCVSYHTEGPTAKPGEGAAYGVYMPITMVTPRHGIVANHWKPLVGSNVYWVSRSGAILTNRVVGYAKIRGDLTVARLETAFSTNDITPAKLLNGFWKAYLYGSTNVVSGLFGVPVIGFDCAERGYVMNWVPTPLRKGRGHSDSADEHVCLTSANGWTMPFFRGRGVGGDSGSPIFWPVDGQTVLLGCFHTAQSAPIPEKSDVDAAIAAWGDDERTVEYNLQDGGWDNPDLPTP